MLMLNNLLKLIQKSRGWLLVYFITLIIYSWFSYGLTTPNLILIQADWFSRFQFWMWDLFFNNRVLLVRTYLSLISLLFVSFGMTVYKLRQVDIGLKGKLFLLTFLCLPLILSYNALSADVFNYIFNAKMVVEYQADPHVKTALDFEYDPWVRFMHNIHTAAPYGYGWTLLSLPAYLVGMGKFFLTWISFRLFSFISLILAAVSLDWLSWHFQQRPLKFKEWALLFLNPLILIEIVSNSHNDLWMMVPALVSLGLLLAVKKLSLKTASLKNTLPKTIFLKKSGYLFLSLTLIAFSISIKLASAVLIPIWLLLAVQALDPSFKNSLVKWFNKHWPLLASILMFLPLFSPRSQQFHPWYLSWSLIWLPLIKLKWWKQLLLAFSITSLLRYVPFLRANDYDQAILFRQKIITSSAPVWLMALHLFTFIKQKLMLVKSSDKTS